MDILTTKKLILMTNPLNAEHIEALELEHANDIDNCDWELPEKIQAFKDAREILREANIPHILMPFFEKKISTPDGGEIQVKLPLLRHNFFDYLKYLPDTDMIDEESGDEYDDFHHKFLYEVFRYFCPISEDSRLEDRLQDFHERCVDAHLYVKEQIQELASEN